MKTIGIALSLLALLGNVPTAQAANTIDSVYTSLKTEDCKTLESHPDEAGWYKGRCKGTAGYQLDLTEGDLRQSLTVITPQNKEFPLELWANVSGGFSALGEKAEWRVQKTANKTQPIALIVRFNVSEDPEKPEKNTSYLVVSKITADKSCVTDVVKPSTTANETARKLADTAANKACKTAAQ